MAKAGLNLQQFYFRQIDPDVQGDPFAPNTTTTTTTTPITQPPLPPTTSTTTTTTTTTTPTTTECRCTKSNIWLDWCKVLDPCNKYP